MKLLLHFMVFFIIIKKLNGRGRGRARERRAVLICSAVLICRAALPAVTKTNMSLQNVNSATCRETLTCTSTFYMGEITMLFLLVNNNFILNNYLQLIFIILSLIIFT